MRDLRWECRASDHSRGLVYRYCGETEMIDINPHDELARTHELNNIIYKIYLTTYV